MEPEKPYTLTSLIQALALSRRDDWVNEDFTPYYRGLVGALEPMMDVSLRREAVPHKQLALWMLFEATMRSMLALTNPWDGFLESSLIHVRLQESGEHGRRIHEASDRIIAATEQSRADHLEMLVALVEAMLGPRPQVITSEQLLAAGFDDAQKPQMQDYWDYA